MDNNYLWWRDGIIYQIYPRSFADSNGDGIGDLDGITARLDYLQDLGVDAIWLSPIYPSPDVDFGYDVSNYLDVDPKFGSLESFDRLIKEAHKRGLRVILDLVLNHTSDQHPWFIESRKSATNPFRDYYLWRDPKPNGDPPNNWLSIFGGGGWELDPTTGQMYFHMFAKQQPDVNWRNPRCASTCWMSLNSGSTAASTASAWMCSMPIYKQPSPADNPMNPLKFSPEVFMPFFRMQHVNDIDQPDMIPLLQDIRAVMDAYGETYLVGETFIGSAESVAYYCGRTNCTRHSISNSCTMSWWARAFYNSIQRLGETARWQDAWPNYVLNNHDIWRSATRFTRGEDDDRLKVAAALLLTLRGTPFLYYGEEIGMRDITLTRDQIMDPMGKNFWPFNKGRDGCRAPMQWSAAPNAGFALPGAETWLPVHPDYQTRNVMSAAGRPGFVAQLV